jgi:hypothetical protein
MVNAYNLKRRELVGDVCLNGGVIWKWILKKQRVTLRTEIAQNRVH